MKSLSVPVRQNILLMLHQLESSRIVLKWAAAPEGKIVKSDVSIAKNYLTDKEMRSLARSNQSDTVRPIQKSSSGWHRQTVLSEHVALFEA